MRETKVTDILDSLLKEERLAVEAYEKFISVVDDREVREGFRQILTDHRDNANKLSERIRSIGGAPDGSIGISDVFSGLKIGLRANGKSSLDVLKMAYDSEDEGIMAAEKVIRSGLDPDSLKLVKDILSNNHDHLHAMLKLIASREI